MGKARDVRYGRRGGGWVDGDPPADPISCDVCGMPVYTGARHSDCVPPPDPDQLSLFE